MNLIPGDGPQAGSTRTAPPAAGAVAARLAALADRLAAEPSLAPSPTVDSLFGDLVRTVVETPPHLHGAVLADPRVAARAAALRRLSCDGETALEHAWAARAASSGDARAELDRFPYADNYRRLVRLELAALAPHRKTPVRSAAVLGCGPLPLTALAYADRLGTPVVGVDNDPAAVGAARTLVSRTHPRIVTIEHGDAAGTDLSTHDVVVLAALVGATPAQKTAVLAGVAARMRPGALLLARSARGLRTLLYPEVHPEGLRGLTVLDVVHPADDVVNSVVVARADQG